MAHALLMPGAIAITGAVVVMTQNPVKDVGLAVLHDAYDLAESKVEPVQGMLENGGVSEAGQMVAAALAGAGLVALPFAGAAAARRRTERQQARQQSSLERLAPSLEPELLGDGVRSPTGSYRLRFDNTTDLPLNNVSVRISRVLDGIRSETSEELGTINARRAATNWIHGNRREQAAIAGYELKLASGVHVSADLDARGQISALSIGGVAADVGRQSVPPILSF